jgi:hypothetical protein
MDGIFGLKDLAARKRALVAESDAYRQTLRFELRNLRLYGAQVRRKFSILALVNPLLSMGAPLAGSLFGKRQPKWLRMAKAAFAGWHLFRRFAPSGHRGRPSAASGKRNQAPAARD